jgi:hypothetical protein
MEIRMVKYLLVALLGLGFAGLAYAAAATKEGCTMGAEGMTCPMMGAAKPVADTPPATAPAAKVDVGNTKCIVTLEDVGDDTLEYQGKLYHICCSSCIKKFNKDPEKYLKPFAADPARFGVKK